MTNEPATTRPKVTKEDIVGAFKKTGLIPIRTQTLVNLVNLGPSSSQYKPRGQYIDLHERTGACPIGALWVQRVWNKEHPNEHLVPVDAEVGIGIITVMLLGQQLGLEPSEVNVIFSTWDFYSGHGSKLFYEQYGTEQEALKYWLQ